MLAHLGPMLRADIYKTKLVAFIDLLGFRDTIERSAFEPELQRRVASVISTYQQTVCEIDAHDIILTGFSDSLVMSAAVTPEGLDGLLSMIGQIARNLLQKDILIRGGVSLGSIHHEGMMTFGPAMNEAYGIETQWAVYPTVILSNAVAAKAAEFESRRVCVDPHRPHLMMLDYLEPMRAYTGEPVAGKLLWDEPAKRIVRHIQNRLIRHRSNQNLYAKAKWLEAYWNSAVSELGVLPTTGITFDHAIGSPTEESTIMVDLQGQKVSITIESQSVTPDR